MLCVMVRASATTLNPIPAISIAISQCFIPAGQRGDSSSDRDKEIEVPAPEGEMAAFAMAAEIFRRSII